MICTKCCQKESNIKDGKEVLCPICRRDWTEWIYEHYPIAEVSYPCARCLISVVNRRSSMCDGCREEMYGGGEEEEDEDEEDAVNEGEEEAQTFMYASTDDVPDISAMLRSLGRSYRSR